MDIPSIPLKRCSICKQEFPATIEFFHSKKNYAYGVSCQCITCERVKRKESYRRNRETILAKQKADYQCDPSKKRAFNQRWLERNPERAKEINRAAYKKRKAYYDAQNRAWAEKHPKRTKEIKRRSAHKHPDRRNKSNQEWLDRNPEKRKEYQARRRALELSAEGYWTGQDVLALYEQQDGHCFYCGISLVWKLKGDIHVDHITPLSKGGTNYPDNLCLACRNCNQSKNDSELEEWQRTRGW